MILKTNLARKTRLKFIVIIVYKTMMKTLTAEPLFNLNLTLGEGPLWHPVEQILYWVDIDHGRLYRSNHSLDDWSYEPIDTTLGAFGFCSDGGLILATGKGFAFWLQEQDQPTYTWNPLPPRKGVRLNDGKVDPAGRFWAGSIDTGLQEGALYRVDPDGSPRTMLTGIGISNGLDWSPHGKRMYYTDSGRSTIYSFDYTQETGEISNQHIFVQLPKDAREIVPDGLCVDAEGCIWSAQWNGWQVVRYDPSGSQIGFVKVPAQRVTSCCFGGSNLNQLFITTAAIGLSETELENQPHAGNLFCVQTDTRGLPANIFSRAQPKSI